MHPRLQLVNVNEESLASDPPSQEIWRFPCVPYLELRMPLPLWPALAVARDDHAPIGMPCR
jgi:hypothetical protein